MRAFLIPVITALAIVAWSCGGSSKSSQSPTAGAASPTIAAAATSPAPAASTTALTPAASTADTGTVDEVTGIVGSVNVATHTILIDRLSGAPVVKITVDSSTVIRQVSGGTITLADVRVSDRIVASGHLNDREDALVATHVTVQDVLPGAQPGG